MAERVPARVFGCLVSLALLAGFIVSPSAAWAAGALVPISGSGSTWSGNALRDWIGRTSPLGLVVDYEDTGSALGRAGFSTAAVDFAVSENPYGMADAFAESDPAPTQRPFTYVPAVAGGTAFMYHLRIDGRLVTNLRLSGDNVARIFTKEITVWDDPRLQADNPGLDLPPTSVTPVVRSDGSGSTTQLTRWMSRQHAGVWNAFCQARGGTPPCASTAFFPVGGYVARTGSSGVVGHVSQANADGAITYVEYSYARQSGFPVVKVLNQAGYYVEPTAEAVGVALTRAEVINSPSDPTTHLTQNLDGVYTNADRRAYPLSGYAYMIVPTTVQGAFTENHGSTLAEFASYALCAGQQTAATLGYSPLPINLVQAGFTQIGRIPGAVTRSDPLASCANPTFAPDGTNTLLQTAPQPPECDNRATGLQCPGSATGLPTTTSLTANTTSVGLGEPVTLIATVHPAGAAGTVQFRRGLSNTPVGSPVEVGAAGTASITTNALPAGMHDLTASFTPTDADVYGPSASPPVIITVTIGLEPTLVALTADVAPGPFSLDVASHASVLAGGAVGGAATGTLPAATVIDLRGTNPGWNVTGQIEDFSHRTPPTNSIPGAQLGWVPSALKVSGSGSVVAGQPVAPGTTPGGLADGVTLCLASLGGGAGTFRCNAALTLSIPDSTLPGSYSATLTLTLV